MSFIGNVRALLNNLARDVRATVTGELGVEVGGNNIDAFGDMVSHQYTPISQFDFVYGGGGANGIYPSTHQIGVTSSAGAGSSVLAGSAGESRLVLTSGTAAGSATTVPSGGFAQFVSQKIVRYRAGQSVLVRFTVVFGVGVAGNVQIAGAGNTVDGYFFGYNETSYGILHRRGSSDTDPVAGWIPQTTWNVDRCDGGPAATNPSGFNINAQLGNVYQIRYPYLGFGPIKFYVLDKSTSLWVLCHIIQYPNSQTVVQITNPGLQFYAATYNKVAGSASSTMMLGSAGAFLSGKREYLGPQFAIQNTKSVTTENNILTLRNCTSYNGVTNRGLIRLRSLSLASDGGNGISTLRLLRNATIGGAPAYTAINGTLAAAGATLTLAQSIASFDVAGTTITAAGIPIFNANLARGSNFVIDLTPFDILIAPGEFLTFAFAATGSAASCAVAINWQEDQ